MLFPLARLDINALSLNLSLNWLEIDWRNFEVLRDVHAASYLMFTHNDSERTFLVPFAQRNCPCCLRGKNDWPVFAMLGLPSLCSSLSPGETMSFLQGFFLGQLTVVLFIGAFIKFFIFGEAHAASFEALEPGSKARSKPLIAQPGLVTELSSPVA